MDAFEPIIQQLKEQDIEYEILQDHYDPHKVSILSKTIKAWSEKFIGKKTAPFIDQYLWHIFSYRVSKFTEGQEANRELAKQFETDTLIFNEPQQYLIKCIKRIPKIEMLDFTDDIYICHHNMKWTYVIPHEIHNGMGPCFSYGDK